MFTDNYIPFIHYEVIKLLKIFKLRIGSVNNHTSIKYNYKVELKINP